VLGGVFLASVLPETVVGKMYIGPAPLPFILLYIAVLLTVVEILSSKSRRSRYMLIGILAWVLMTVQGIFGGSESKYLTIDASMFCSMLLGLRWGQQRPLGSSANAIHLWLAATACVLALTVIGLSAGLIEASPASLEIDEPRIFTYSMFEASALLIIGLPFWWSTSRRYLRAFAIVALGSVLVTALVSATRSLVIFVICTLLAGTGRSSAGGKRREWWLLPVQLIALVSFAALVWSRGGGVIERVSSTNVHEETRYLEALQMFESLPNVLTGSGFGGRFVSPVMVDGEYLALTPHVAVLTLLFKGGAIVFGIFVLVPFVVSVYMFVRSPAGPLRACYAGVLLYILRACISGGWDVPSLFLYGALGGMTLHRNNMMTEKRVMRQESHALGGAS
jgi:hypothetical protein